MQLDRREEYCNTCQTTINTTALQHCNTATGARTHLQVGLLVLGGNFHFVVSAMQGKVRYVRWDRWDKWENGMEMDGG